MIIEQFVKKKSPVYSVSAGTETGTCQVTQVKPH